MDIERSVTITEKELELLTEACDGLEKRMKLYARNTERGYNTVASEMKREQYLDKARMIRELISKIGYEFI